MQNGFIQVPEGQFMPMSDITGSDPALCLAPFVTWRALDDSTGGFRPYVFPVPALNADWRQAIADAAVAMAATEIPDVNITHVVFSDYTVIEIPQV